VRVLTAFLRVLLVACVFAAALPAQHGGEAKHEQGSSDQTLWKFANFLILAGALGYFIYKKGGGFFRSRTGEIQRGIKEAAALRAGADSRYAEMERRLAQLGAEVEGLRRQALEESRAEGERMRQQGQRQLETILRQAEQEIVAVAKSARQRLRADAAEMAVQLAAVEIRRQLTPETDRALAGAMVHELSSRFTDQAGVS
jgi:F-type H+-transporting ATPase subunit b